MRKLSTSLALGLLAPSAAFAQVTFTVIGVGRAADISSDGTYVAGQDNGGAFLYGPGGTTSLGQQDAVAVSDDGSVVFGNMTDVNGDTYAGRWTQATGWVTVGALGGQSGNSVSSGYGMSNDGNVATGLGWNNAADGAAFLYENGVSTQLPQLGPNSHRGNAVSGNGGWVGGWDEGPTGPRRAALWDPSQVESLILEDPAVNPEGIGEVFGISTDGTWVCGTGSPNFGARQGFVWSQATGAIYTGEGPPGGGFFDAGFANGVTDDGSVVVGQWGSGPFSFRGTIWTQATGLVLFDDYLAANNVASAAGWQVTAVTAITPDGRTVVGNAVQGGFLTSWFIATIDTSVGTNYCTAAVNDAGLLGSISGRGSLNVVDNDFELVASDVTPFQFGIFVVSRTQDFVPGSAANSNGNLCLGGTIGRFNGPGQIQTSGAAGAFSLGVDLTAIPQGTSISSVAPGETWNFQAWHREFSGFGSNFTDGLSVQFQ